MYPQRVLTPSRKVDECKPMPDGTQLSSSSRDGTVRVWDAHTRSEVAKLEALGRGLHSSTSQLNLSRF
jgi:WD40 repeat protein